MGGGVEREDTVVASRDEADSEEDAVDPELLSELLEVLDCELAWAVWLVGLVELVRTVCEAAEVRDNEEMLWVPAPEDP